ncbi:MAG TPA: MtrB/PioB family outer membrane beta-barrel protein, partial [Thermoanaerobaculia bacterium]|nr:MtrB/PioB family outer membrane beta-barrel protein [Thermoanaerobaculia bacterium]
GVVIPYFRLFGDGVWRYNLVAENVLRKDGRYRLFVEREPVRIKIDYNRIPHRFGNGGRTLLEETRPGVLEMSDTIQRAHQTALEQQFAANRNGITFPFLSNLVAPSLQAANTVDLALLRERGNAQIDLYPGKPFSVRLNYFQEKRTGNRAAGTSFGFGNVVETPEPIDYRTEEFGASAEYGQSWGLIRGAVRYNTFKNPINTLTFDNPFRVTDATDPSAYTAPGSGSIGGASRGRIDLSADNEALTGALGFQVRLPANSRFTADISASRWTQDDRFMPFSTNSAITTPVVVTDINSLPERSLDGEINVVSQSYFFSSRPIPKLGLTARYRIYDLNNDTRRIEFPGYVRFDAVWEDIPRISVPYAYKVSRGDATVSYDFGPLDLEGGYRYLKWNREFRETRETTENTFIVAANLRMLGWAQLRASYETGERDHGAYNLDRSEHASYAEPEDIGILPSLRRFDQAKRDVDRFFGLLQLTPGGDFTVSLSYLFSEEDYRREPVVDASGLRYGLVDSKSQSFTAEADYSPGDRWSLYGFYTREKISNFLRGRQSGATPSTNPLDDWTSDMDDKVDSFGGGATVALLPDRLDLRALVRYQKLNGNNDLASPAGGTPDIAFPISAFDDTKIWTASAELEYHLARFWSLALGGWAEDYKTNDSATTGLRNYVPGSFFLAANDSNYKARVGYLRASYRW